MMAPRYRYGKSASPVPRHFCLMHLFIWLELLGYVFAQQQGKKAVFSPYGSLGENKGNCEQ